MNTSLASVVVIAMFAVAVSLLGVRRPSPEPVAAPAVSTEGTKMLGRLPVAFVPNLGQWEHAAQYVARVGAMTVFLERQGWSFTLVERTPTKQREGRDSLDSVDEKPAHGVAVRMAFADAMRPEMIAEQRLPGAHNYFLGNDPSKWRSDVPLYGAIRYREVYSGVDVRAREHDGHFEYDLLLQPGADLEPVEFVVEGTDRMHLDEEGALVMETRLGPVRMPVPRSWEEAASGEKQPVACQYELRGSRFGFKVTGRRPGWALVVDPGLVWSTHLGGTNIDGVSAIALDAQGAATVAGTTSSAGFPTTPGAFDTSYNGGNEDAFVTRLSSTGSILVYSTFVGGVNRDAARAIALDAQGAATVAGWTQSVNFPWTLGAFDTSFNGVYDVFVTRLSPTGSALVYSTFLGGDGGDAAYAIALDAQGAATLAGYTTSSTVTHFPTTPGAFNTSHGGVDDAFVTRLSPTGATLVYSTFLGGTNLDRAFALALDAQGAATVAGYTMSTSFPITPGAFDMSLDGSSDVFVTQVSPNGSTLGYSTFLGGASYELPMALAIDAQGAATVAGSTWSTDYPTTPGAFATTNGGDSDAFVTRLSPTGSTIVYSTYLGGASADGAYALALDAQGAATVAGGTLSINFPTTPGAFDTSYNGGASGFGDAFVTRLSATGSTIVYSTYLGGASADGASAIALDAQGVATVGGASSATFPTTPGAFDPSHNGGHDAFVARLDMLPTGVAAFGNSSPGCNGPLPISVNSMPQVGNLVFALTCSNAAPNSIGVIGFSAAGLVTPIPVLGVDVWIDPTALWTAAAFSNPIGASEVPLPIPPTPTLAGVRFFTQFVWFGPVAPPPCPPMGLSATNALDVTIQP